MPANDAQELLIVASGEALASSVADLRGVLARLQAAACQEAGCQRYEFFIDGTKVLMVERWADAAAFDQHTRTPTFVECVPVLKSLLAGGTLNADIVNVQSRQAVVI
jgi:quinol monooxygenase YgiN